MLFVSFVLQFHSAFASPPHPWQFIDEEGAAGFTGQYTEVGYECGNDIFSDSDINEALFTYYQYMNQNFQSPLAYHTPPGYPNIQQYPNSLQELEDPLEVADLDVRKYLDFEEVSIPVENNIPQEYQSTQQHFTPTIYHGPLYSDSGSSNYILWPIYKEKMISSFTKYTSDPYYIVIKKNDGEFTDVISRIKNNYHTRCIRIDGLRTALLTTAPDMNNGYLCAHEFLSDELIQKSLGMYWGNTRKISKYPAPFVGRLFPAVGGYMIWPILSGDILYDPSSDEAGPYFLVVDRQGNLIGTVVEGLSGNFLRCPRSRKISKISPSNAPNHSQVPKTIIKSGYYCGMLFFDDNAVQEAAKAARNTKRRKPLQILPAIYKGSEFNEKIFLWPLMQSGILFKTGSPGFYRVLLTNEFKVKGVAIMQRGKFKLCEKGTVEEEKEYEKNNYFCIDHVLSSRDLDEAAKSGCDSFPKRSDRFYPARYEGPDFDKKGPYFTYPVRQGGGFVASPGKDRVVINIKCEIVGVLTSFPSKKNKPRSKTFVFCIKSQERTAEKTYEEPATPISEHSCGNSRQDLYRHS